MINRKEIKANAKNLVKTSYWENIGAGILLTLATATGITYLATKALQQNVGPVARVQSLVCAATPKSLFAALGIILVSGTALSMIISMLQLLLTRPLEVGCQRYFLNHRNGKAKLNDCLSGYTENVGNVYSIMLIRDVKIALWKLLFFVPGIVKKYEYKMVPYLLAKNPDMNRREVFAQSKAMMYGHKMDAFKLDLSFIGWAILGVCSFGLVSGFYSRPYIAAANAEFFETICAAA